MTSWNPAIRLLAIALLLMGPSGLAREGETEQPVVVDGTIHSPDEIFLILDRSELVYEMEVPVDSLELLDSMPPPLLNVDWYREELDDGSTRLNLYQPDDSTLSALAWADTLFAEGKYAEGIVEYYHVLELYPEYYQMYTWIAQSYYKTGKLDSALHYYRLAIERNFVDYDAHWFLGDLYLELTDTAYALRHLTIGHILNKHHVRMKERLVQVRRIIGQPWREWDFRPLWRTAKTDRGVRLETTINWITYAMTMAIWKHEPGYAERMGSQPLDSVIFNPEAEREAIAVWVMGKINSAEANSTALPEDAARIRQIIEDGELMPMIYYELLAARHPGAVPLLPRQTIDDMVEYVNTYH